MNEVFVLCISIEGKNFCNSSGELKIDGATFSPLPSLTFVGQKTDGIIVQFSADFENVERFQGKRIAIFYYNHSSKKVNAKKMLVYKIFTLTSVISLECVSLEFLLSLGRASLFSLNCRCNFGDKNCKLDISQFSTKGMVEEFLEASNQIYDSNLKLENPEKFINGKIKINNSTFVVLLVEDCKIKILNEIGVKFAKHDKYELISGCDKTLKTCKEVYKNSSNFRGEPFIFEKFSSSIL